MSVKNKTFYKTYAYIKSITVTPLITLCITSNHFLKNAKSFSFSDAYHNFVFALEDPLEKCRNLIWTFKNYFLKKGLDEKHKIKLKMILFILSLLIFSTWVLTLELTIFTVLECASENIPPTINNKKSTINDAKRVFFYCWFSLVFLIPLFYYYSESKYWPPYFQILWCEIVIVYRNEFKAVFFISLILVGTMIIGFTTMSLLLKLGFSFQTVVPLSIFFTFFFEVFFYCYFIQKYR